MINLLQADENPFNGIERQFWVAKYTLQPRRLGIHSMELKVRYPNFTTPNHVVELESIQWN